MKIALLGSIPKGDAARSDWTDWKAQYTEAITKALPDAEILHGDTLSDNAGTEMVVGHDLAMVKRADICIVDAQTKVGAGTAQEIVMAKYMHKPVVIVMPKDSHHRKSNITFHGVTMQEWINPFLKISSDYVGDSVADAIRWIQEYEQNPSKYPIKDITVFEHAIEYYEAYEKST